MTRMRSYLQEARQAIIRGEPDLALQALDQFASAAEDSPPTENGVKDEVRATLAELQALAQASLEGATSAAELIRDIVQSARTIQTYDGSGQRCVASTVARMPRRF